MTIEELRQSFAELLLKSNQTVDAPRRYHNSNFIAAFQLKIFWRSIK